MFQTALTPALSRGERELGELALGGRGKAYTHWLFLFAFIGVHFRLLLRGGYGSVTVAASLTLGSLLLGLPTVVQGGVQHYYFSFCEQSTRGLLDALAFQFPAEGAGKVG